MADLLCRWSHDGYRVAITTRRPGQRRRRRHQRTRRSHIPNADGDASLYLP